MSDLHATDPANIALWDAINAYAEACGGDTSDATVGDARMDAVVAVSRALRKYVAAVRHSRDKET